MAIATTVSMTNDEIYVTAEGRRINSLALQSYIQDYISSAYACYEGKTELNLYEFPLMWL